MSKSLVLFTLEHSQIIMIITIEFPTVSEREFPTFLEPTTFDKRKVDGDSHIIEKRTFNMKKENHIERISFRIHLSPFIAMV